MAVNINNDKDNYEVKVKLKVVDTVSPFTSRVLQDPL